MAKIYQKPGSTLLQFQDNFVRADSNTPGRKWSRLLLNANAANGNQASCTDGISTNNLIIAGTGQLNPVGFNEPFFTPNEVYPNLYTKDRTFVEVTSVSLALGGGGVIGMAVRCNTDLRTGIGAREYDNYFFDLTTGSIGAVTRFTSTGSALIIAGQGWTHPNTFKMRVSGQGSSVLIETFLNGVAGATFSDTDAKRVLTGSPGIHVFTIAGLTSSFVFRASSFKCGVF